MRERVTEREGHGGSRVRRTLNLSHLKNERNDGTAQEKEEDRK